MKVEVGDLIFCRGVKVRVEKIYSQYVDGDYIACEFLDENGICRFWKQRFDGGKLIKAV